MMRVKKVSSKEALEKLEKIYLMRGLTPIWTRDFRLEAYDKTGKLNAVAEVSP